MRFALTLLFLLAFSSLALAQDKAETRPTAPARTMSTADKFEAERIPRNSKVYIAHFLNEGEKDTGFATYLAAAIRKKNVPVVLVNDDKDADFVVSGSADQKGAGAVKKILLGDFHKTTSASIAVTNTRTGIVAFADSSHRESAARGMRSSAEKLAKYLKKKIEDDEKKAAKM